MVQRFPQDHDIFGQVRRDRAVFFDQQERTAVFNADQAVFVTEIVHTETFGIRQVHTAGLSQPGPGHSTGGVFRALTPGLFLLRFLCTACRMCFFPAAAAFRNKKDQNEQKPDHSFMQLILSDMIYDLACHHVNNTASEYTFWIYSAFRRVEESSRILYSISWGWLMAVVSARTVTGASKTDQGISKTEFPSVLTGRYFSPSTII